MPSWSGLYDDVSSEAYALKVNTTRTTKPILKVISKMLRKRGKANRAIVELFDKTIGAAAGGAVSSTYTRPLHVNASGEFGGLRTIETVAAITGVSTATDVSELKEVFSRKFRPTTYPTDLSGNGGGNKAGTI